MPFSRIVAATDLRIESDEAIRQALAIARGRHRVAICHVLPDTRLVRSLFPQLHADDAVAALEVQRWAREEIDRCLSRVGSPDVDVYLETGSAHARVLARARNLQAELIVVGGPQVWPRPTGTAQQIVRGAPMPVLVARSSPRGPLLAATDLSDPSIAALKTAARQAAALGLPLEVVHVVDVEREAGWLAAVRRLGAGGEAYSARVAEAVERAGTELAALVAEHAPGATAHVAHGRAATAIVQRARAIEASVIFVATHGRGGLDRMLVGSVAEEVVMTASCSVLAVRHIA
ncbi:MAG: universal stress protein [Polyangiaceae bacterium]|nr:universal stress protein [Polyangiaceae bacterium]